MIRIGKKDLLLGATVLVGFVLLIKAAQVALTPEFWAWLDSFALALLQSPAVGFLLLTATALFLLLVIAASWDRATKRHARHEAEKARAQAVREEQVRESLRDAYPPATDSEVRRFLKSERNERDPRVA